MLTPKSFICFSFPCYFIFLAKRCRILITLAWMFAGLFSAPMLFMYEEKIVDGIPQCWLDLQDPWMWQVNLYDSIYVLLTPL